MRVAKQAVLTIAVILAIATSLRAQSQVPWVTNWQEAASLAQRNQRLVLIHFWSNNCPPCVRLERTVFNRPEVIRAIVSNYVPLKVNVDQQPDLARHFRVQQWPTDIILTAEGDVLSRGPSPQEMNQFIAKLDQVASHARIGLPISGSPSTQVATTPGSDLNRSSAFPLAATGNTAGNTASSLPPANSNNYGQSTSAITSPARHVANTWPPQQPLGQATPPSGAPRGAMVNNQYAGADPRVDRPPHEQQASFNTSSGGEFQLPGQVVQQRLAPPQPAQAGSQPAGAQQPTVQPPVAQQRNPYADNASAGLGAPAASVALNEQLQNPTVPPVVTEAPPGPPTLALDGYCCVRLVEEEKWVKGDPQWGAVHRGRTYLFSGPEEQRRFMANFDKYAPALSGFDCVKYAERRALVEGKRAHGIFYRGRIFLFADEAALQKFWNAPDKYVPLVQAEQDRHAARR